MKVVDANILLYATNRDATHHSPARRWLDQALSGNEIVAFPWVVVLAFLRISTRPGIFASPLTVEQAHQQVDAWLQAQPSRLLHPASSHLSTLRRCLEDLQAGGNLVTDAHLAALAIDNNAELISYDTDFNRFRDLHWSRPADHS